MRSTKFNQYFLFLIGVVAVLAFQNCSIYQSEGVDMFRTQLLLLNTGEQCLPFMDVNAASSFMQSGGVNVLTNRSGGHVQDPLMCKFVSRSQVNHPTGEVLCLFSTSDRSDLYGIAETLSDFYNTGIRPDEQMAMVQSLIPSANSNTIKVYSDTVGSSFVGYSYETFDDQGNEIRIMKYFLSRSLTNSHKCSGLCVSCAISTTPQLFSSGEASMKMTLESMVLHAGAYLDRN